MLSLGEPMGTEVHSSISILLPIKSEISGQPITLLATLLGLFDPEDGGDMFVRNVG
jgi:hypothetical protein